VITPTFTLLTITVISIAFAARSTGRVTFSLGGGAGRFHFIHHAQIMLCMLA